MANSEALKQYVKQLQEFRDHMLKEFEDTMEDPTDNNCFDFFNSNFEITFRGKSVKLGNGAEVFQSIEELIDYEIEEWEE